jgi:electron transport complex protein RnfA
MGFLTALGVFSSLSLNLALQFGLGMRGISAGRRKNHPVPFLEAGVIFLSVLILWLFFTYILAPLRSDFFMFFLPFPLSALACIAFEWLLVWLIRRYPVPEPAGSVPAEGEEAVRGGSPPVQKKRNPRLFRGISAYDGLVPLALLLTLNVGVTFLEAAVLSLGFALGILLAALILKEIRRRSSLEAVPALLRGDPITLISMGLLSLIFTFAGVMFFNALRF